MKQTITFASQGVSCTGWLFVPDDLEPGTKRPAIVMAHGFAAIKEMYLTSFAERFTTAGFITLVFDYRFFGESQGEPRQQLFPQAQLEDYRNAITWLTLQPQVDSARIGVWGTSYGGGHIFHLAAFDKRVKAAVTQVPAVNGWETAQRLMPSEVFQQLLGFLAQDRIERYTKGSVNTISVVALDAQPAVFSDPQSYEWLMQAKNTIAPTWQNYITIESLERVLEYTPGANAHLISSTPFLLILANQDSVAPIDFALAAYVRIGEPKALMMIDGDHYDVYHEPANSKAAEAAIVWYQKHL